MPELPDLEVYVEHIGRRVVGSRLERVRVVGLNLLRTVDPEPRAAEGRTVQRVFRLGKRIVLALTDDLFLAIHLMIAGRFRWQDHEVHGQLRGGLAVFMFDSGTLLLTEAGSRQRASLHVVRGRAALRTLDSGGLEVLGASEADFRRALLREDHTLKRALTDPRILSGIGNAYSDEILHRARLSPFRRTVHLNAEEWERLHRATVDTLSDWLERLRSETGTRFPDQVTAFREGMAVHGRYRKPCPECGAPVQRVVYADNQMNYCPRCQTGGRLLADRALSRLLKSDWPRTLEELEARADDRLAT